MSKIPDSFIEELKAKTSLVRYVKQYTLLREVGLGIWQGACPHPDHDDSTPSFTVWEKTNSWACYGCHTGKKGLDGNLGSDIYAFIQWIEGVNFVKAVHILAEWNNVPVPTDQNQKEYDRNYRLASKYQKDLLETEPHLLEYLYERGFDDCDIEQWMIGYDKATDRIVFPLLDTYKNVIGFNKRVVDKEYHGGDKYKNSVNSKIFNKSSYLYGIHLLDHSYREIRITEGSIDVALAKKYGVKNVVATLGTAFTEQHAKVISRMGLTPVLIFDGDEAGNKGLYKALAYFESLGVYCKIVRLPQGKDLADIASELKFGTENFLRRNSMTAGFLHVKDIIDEYNNSLYQLRIETIPKLEEVLKLVPKTEKRYIKSFIKDELNISVDE